MLRRSNFRDYYDIYSILKNGADIEKMISSSLEHSNHQLKSKSLLAMLTNGDLFKKDESFSHLKPRYDVTSKDIEMFIKSILETRKHFNISAEAGVQSETIQPKRKVRR